MKKFNFGYILIIPQVILILIFLLGIFGGFLQSFGYIPAINLTEFTFKYYKEAFANKELMISLKYSLYIAFVSSVISVLLGVILSLVIVKLKKHRSIFYEIVKIPIIVPHSVVALFVIILFTQNGFFSRIFYNLSIISSQNEFFMLVYDKYAIGIILAYLWKEVPFIIYTTVAVMGNIDERMGEASKNLGANSIQTFFKVTLPLTLPTIMSAFIIIFVFNFAAYDLPFLLGATKPKAISILAYEQYTYPDLQRRPYAMAINGIISFISISFAFVYFYLIRKSEENLKDII